MDRRRFLELLGLSGAALSVGACGTPAATTSGATRTPAPSEPWDGAVGADTALFPIGIQSGDPTPSGAILWTRYLGSAALSAVVSRHVDGRWSEPETWPATVADGGYVHVDVEGFEADQHLAFQFVDADGRASAPGSLATAIDPDHPGPVRFAVTSCLHQQHLAFPSLNAALWRGPLDFVSWLGDTVYCDACVTLADFRALYQQNLTAPGFREILAAVPGIFTLDDHEVANDFDPELTSQGRIAVALDAFFETLPIRRDTERPRRIWRSLRFGRACEVFVLDCRTERKPSVDRYLSRDQLDWLKQGLASSDATWKLVMNSVPITELPEFSLRDRWQGYPEQRDELLDHITGEGLEGVLFLSGDIHSNMLARMGTTGPRSRVWEVLGGPGGSFRNPAGPFLEQLEHVVYADALHSATVIELQTDGTAHIQVVGEEDQTWMDATLDASGELLSLTVEREA